MRRALTGLCVVLSLVLLPTARALNAGLGEPPASVDRQTCMSCHAESYCQSCHDALQKPLSVHPNDYLTNFERKYRIEGRPIYRASYRMD